MSEDAKECCEVCGKKKPLYNDLVVGMLLCADCADNYSDDDSDERGDE
jgi:hypothetical protein